MHIYVHYHSFIIVIINNAKNKFGKKKSYEQYFKRSYKMTKTYLKLHFLKKNLAKK